MSTVQEGTAGGDDFESIDIGELQSGVASEPQLAHTPYDLSFINVSSPSDTEAASGSIEPEKGSSEASWGEIRSRKSRPGGRASQYLENKGFGWLLEVEDEGEEEDKPLL